MPKSPNQTPYSEVDVHQLMKAILADIDWLVPIATAQRTYRSVYYGMTATALLEDVHFDAMSNWIAKFAPSIRLEKPERGAGATEGDYVINSLPVSHKSMDGPTSTGVHWDPLVAAKRGAGGAANLWTSNTPMIVVSAKHEKLTTEIYDGRTKIGTVRTVYPPVKNEPAKMHIAIVKWSENNLIVFKKFERFPSFEEFWLEFSHVVSRAGPANEIDLAWVPEVSELQKKYRVVPIVRAGCYVLARSQLTKVKLGKNNRASLIEKNQMRDFMRDAEIQGRFCPMPLWPGIFAGNRPPDLFLAVKAQFDSRFSPVRDG